jgi:murein DD-endopeptidase MepM/ murein hydrolase activator NlpD
MRKIIPILLVIVFSVGSLGTAFAATENELRAQIDQKNKDLQVVNDQIKQAQLQLDQIESDKRSLNGDIKSLDTTINQLNLKIKSSQVKIDQLNLQLQLLQNKKADTVTNITSQKDAIARLIMEINQNDSQNIFHMLIKGNTLADSLLEMQSVQDLQNNLSVNIVNLTKLNEDLSNNIKDTSATENNLETESQNLKNRKGIASDTKLQKNTLLATTKNKESVYQQQLTILKNQQSVIDDELDKLESNLRSTFNISVLPFKRSGVLAYPVLDPVITQNYGASSFAERAYKTGFHNGIDFKASIGTTIVAAGDGVVYAVGDNGRTQYGKYIVIKHSNNLATLYGHLSRQTVGVGDTVKVGQIIGYSGRTGYITGPHLHFGVYWGPSLILQRFAGAGLVPVGVTINPKDYL